MKNLMSLGALLACLFTLPLSAQTNNTAPPIPTSPEQVLTTGGQWIENANTNVSLFAEKEIEFRLGGVYIQSTGDGGASIEGEYWGILKPNLGFGAAVVQGNVNGKAGTGASYAEIAYRKTFGDVSASLFVGPGYDFQNKSFMGVVGARITKRINAHAGVYVGLGYAVEALDKNRGIITGAGVTYSF